MTEYTQEMHDAVHAVIEYAGKRFDGSRQSCVDLEELIWQVRLTHHHEPEMNHVEQTFIEIDLEELGL